MDLVTPIRPTRDLPLRSSRQAARRSDAFQTRHLPSSNRSGPFPSIRPAAAPVPVVTAPQFISPALHRSTCGAQWAGQPLGRPHHREHVLIRFQLLTESAFGHRGYQVARRKVSRPVKCELLHLTNPGPSTACRPSGISARSK